MVGGSNMIGFPLKIADSEQDMPGFEPEPAGLAHQHSTNLALRENTLFNIFHGGLNRHP